MESVSVMHDDGTFDSYQRAHVGSTLDAARLERLYWDEIGRVTFGAARFSRDALRLAGIWPPLLRFGPVIGGKRVISGGLFARRAGGTIGWSADDEHTSVAVEGFVPLLRGPFWRGEAWLHDAIGRRFLSRVARESG
jgi:hypothetical protein